ncbi:MAG TPA: ABC transporter permease [Novosphingobium sp.]|nr:ABC transporter permease [Novosphingobium sp.]
MIRTLRSAWVVARRDFVAVIWSKAFLFFLLGPLFPIVVGALAGGIGAQVARSVDRPQLGLALPADEIGPMVRARNAMAEQMAGTVPELVVLDRLAPGESFDARAAMGEGRARLAAVLSGSLAAPRLTGTAERVEDWEGMVATLTAAAREGLRAPAVPPSIEIVANSAAKLERGRLATAQAGQTVLFLLTMLLAGMVLSNLVEEKGNKIIEVLAAAIPMDALFLGKLFAMLGVSFVGIGVWVTVGGAAMAAAGSAMPVLPVPAVGWPLFLALGFLYFAMAYLLLGSLFLGIGSMAATVREVQTMSMPVTMLQLLVFFFASLTVAQEGRPLELLAIAFPFSSPFAMLARAAQSPALWPHFAALAWQALWVVAIIRLGARIFRRSVMKSGAARGRAERRGRFARLRGKPVVVDSRVGLAG